MNPKKRRRYSIEAGPMGPIGEGEALILRVSRNCPWNKCLFCPVYKGRTFSRRDAEEIKNDIDAVQRIRDLIDQTSWHIGFSGRINRELLTEVVRHHPEIYGNPAGLVSQDQYEALISLQNTANWMMCGSRRVFLQDANALATKSEDLAEVLRYLKGTFPSVQTITCYARSKTCSQKSLEELYEIKEAGLSWVFVGIESGCDEVLKYMQKGVTGAEHSAGGQAVQKAGINMAAFVMPGLAGNDRQLAQRHVTETLRILNDIKPAEIRIRSLAVIENSPLYGGWRSGEFSCADDDQMIDEIRLILEGLTFDCTFETLQMTNVLFAVKGTLSAIRESLFAQIGEYQAKDPRERLRFRFNKYVSGGYLDCVQQWGKYDEKLNQVIEEARQSLEGWDPAAGERTEEAICSIKSKGIP